MGDLKALSYLCHVLKIRGFDVILYIPFVMYAILATKRLEQDIFT